MPAPELVLVALEKTFDGRSPVRALAGCTLRLDAGECVAILGESGCGKTTLLRAVAGLEFPDSGSVKFAGRDVTRESAERRGVGFVFQHDALFARMTAYENIAFGLRVRHVAADERDVRIRAAATRVRAAHLLERRVASLSGGEKQRVALARALVVEPGILLCDEPLSRLDTPLRAELRRELAALARTRVATMLYVTHDQGEAMALGDRIAIMRAGAIVQAGTAEEIFERPIDTFVAAALGAPAIALVAAAFVFDDAVPGERCGVRASGARLTPEGELRGIVSGVEDFIDVAYAYVEGDFGTIAVRVAGEARPRAGERVAVSVDRAHALRFDASGMRIESRVRA